MTLPILDTRLLRASGFIRESAYLADIGTDHAYLPIYLSLIGRIDRALASDINDGPVLRAKQSVAKYGVADKIDVIKSAGLDGAVDYPVTDVVIAGMGGELIASILSDAPWIKNEKYNLVLQPMTHPEILRKYLLFEGFSIIGEDVVSDMKDRNAKVYQIINAVYTGKTDETYTAPELLFGRLNTERGGEEFYRLCQREAKKHGEIVKAKEAAGQDCAYEREILSFAQMILERNGQ